MEAGNDRHMRRRLPPSRWWFSVNNSISSSSHLVDNVPLLNHKLSQDIGAGIGQTFAGYHRARPCSGLVRKHPISKAGVANFMRARVEGFHG